MIRVTLKDNTIEEFEDCKVNVATYSCGNIITHRYIEIYFYGNDEDVSYDCENVIKIEKQVKDLNLEEIKWLNENTDFNLYDYIDSYRNGWHVVEYISNEHFDDYIDITELVVGK